MYGYENRERSKVVEDWRNYFRILGTSSAVNEPSFTHDIHTSKGRGHFESMIASAAGKNTVSMHAEENPVSLKSRTTY